MQLLYHCSERGFVNMKTRKELRASARTQLQHGLFTNEWLSALLICLVVSILCGIPFAAIILMGPLSFGMARYFLNLGRNKEHNFINLFDGFSNDFAQTFLLGLLQSLFIFLWSLLLIVPGIIKSYSYSMAFYIQNDDENKDWKYCLDKSREMMDGHKMDLFILDLSFIGWYILGFICLFFGVLWVIPYHTAARANFYRDLIGETIE